MAGGVLVFRDFRLRHMVQQWIVPTLLHGVEMDQDKKAHNFF